MPEKKTQRRRAKQLDLFDVQCAARGEVLFSAYREIGLDAPGLNLDLFQGALVDLMQHMHLDKNITPASIKHVAQAAISEFIADRKWRADA